MTTALILAAVQGTRLRPLTNNKPKCLVKLCGKSLLDRQARVLKQVGVKELYVVGSYLIDAIKEKGYQCIENKVYEKMNMVASLLAGLTNISVEDDFLISYGDIVYQSENLKNCFSAMKK